ncbi:uncharacterized protein LOC133203223 [Saccostrea echinata]|uniref:uncharacterized protein LOC133203223 n=1 Tax=Saccostrea echinata TaxID=191078 RepID=UPI002A803A2F|nr:uncharacterized protein LOC133203223 [Saccostrea echinata]
MSDLTMDYWLNLAPCPPPWNPGLLYRTPYPVNLTEGEVQRIAERCKVPPKDTLIMSSSVRNTSSVVLPALVSLFSVTLLGTLIAVLVYRHRKPSTGDSCLQPMDSKCDLLEEVQDRGNKGFDNATYMYKGLKTGIQHPDKTNTQRHAGNSNKTKQVLRHPDNTNTQQDEENFDKRKEVTQNSEKAKIKQDHQISDDSFSKQGEHIYENVLHITRTLEL